MIGLPMVLVMLKIELPTMVPGYPLKLTPKTPVRPLPLMVMTAPGSAPVGPVIPVGTTVPLEIEKVNGCRALSFGGVQVPTELALKVTKAAFQVQVPVLGGMVVPSPLLGSVEVLQVEGSRGVSRFRLDIRDKPPAVDGRSFTPLIATTSPMARVPVSAVVIVIVPPDVVGNAGDRCNDLRKRTDVNHRSSWGQKARAGDKGSGSVRMLRVATGSGQPRDGRLIQPGDRGQAGSRGLYCMRRGRIDVPLALLGSPRGHWTKDFGICQRVRAIKGCCGCGCRIGIATDGNLKAA